MMCQPARECTTNRGMQDAMQRQLSCEVALCSTNGVCVVMWHVALHLLPHRGVQLNGRHITASRMIEEMHSSCWR